MLLGFLTMIHCFKGYRIYLGLRSLFLLPFWIVSPSAVIIDMVLATYIYIQLFANFWILKVASWLANCTSVYAGSCVYTLPYSGLQNKLLNTVTLFYTEHKGAGYSNRKVVYVWTTSKWLVIETILACLLSGYRKRSVVGNVSQTASSCESINLVS